MPLCSMIMLLAWSVPQNVFLALLHEVELNGLKRTVTISEVMYVFLTEKTRKLQPMGYFAHTKILPVTVTK